MRLKIGKKLKTASHNSKFTDSYQKRVNTLCTYYFIVDCSRVARISQGGRRGFFGSLIQPKRNLTQIFISLKLDWGGFSVKIRWSQKKKRKKRSSPKFKRFFRPKSETQGFFSAECRWSPIKKRSSPKFKGFFRPKLGDIKKKKGLHRLWVSSRTKKSTILVQTTASSSQLLLPNPFRMGCFHFWSKNRPQKH